MFCIVGVAGLAYVHVAYWLRIWISLRVMFFRGSFSPLPGSLGVRRIIYGWLVRHAQALGKDGCLIIWYGLKAKVVKCEADLYWHMVVTDLYSCC